MGSKGPAVRYPPERAANAAEVARARLAERDRQVAPQRQAPVSSATA